MMTNKSFYPEIELHNQWFYFYVGIAFPACVCVLRLHYFLLFFVHTFLSTKANYTQMNCIQCQWN